MYRRVWMITCNTNGFKYKVFVEATEENLLQFMKTEIPNAIKYVGATNEEVKAAKILKLPIYLI